MKQNNHTLRIKLKTIYCDWILSSTSHGFPNILKSKNFFIKFIWIIFTTVSTGLCAYMISENIIKYFKSEVVTKTRLINQYSAIFPTITICNMNFFTSEFSINFSKKLKMQNLKFSPFSSLYEFNFKLFVKSFNESYSDSVDKLIIDCFYEFSDCNRSEFSFFFHPIHGNCYQFNSKKNFDGNAINLKSSFYKERISGLRLILNLSVSDSLKYLNPNEGALIFIHNHTDYPVIIDPVTIAPRTETNIALFRNFFESKEKPFSDCDRNTKDPTYLDFKAYQLVHKNTSRYTKDLCFYQCIQEDLFETCGCVDSYYPYFAKSSFCSNKTEIDCLDEFFKLKRNFQFCFDKCPLECDAQWFDKTISINNFSQSKYQYLFQNFNFSKNTRLNINGSFDELSIVNIYYQSFSYLLTNEYPTIELVDLLSSIGGIAGLFLGISVLSVVEIVELIVLIFLEIKNNAKIMVQKN